MPTERPRELELLTVAFYLPRSFSRNLQSGFGDEDEVQGSNVGARPKVKVCFDLVSHARLNSLGM